MIGLVRLAKCIDTTWYHIVYCDNYIQLCISNGDPILCNVYHYAGSPYNKELSISNDHNTKHILKNGLHYSLYLLMMDK